MRLIGSERFSDHQPPDGHPERPERARVMADVSRRWVEAGGLLSPPRVATRDELVRIHAPIYVDQMAEITGQRLRLDPDTYTSSNSYNIARLAAGAAIAAVEYTLAERAPVIAFVRPPGHHAEADRAMGFCLFNNVAVAARYAIKKHKLNRVFIFDWDVHHGNGTQHSFYSDPTVYYSSAHQYPFYPGTGGKDETGTGDGLGSTLNFPLNAFSEDSAYLDIIENKLIPEIEKFRPELIIISAGFDAHKDDPLAQMKVSTSCYGKMTSLILKIAKEVCNGRLLSMLEGGYNHTALANSVLEHMNILITE